MSTITAASQFIAAGLILHVIQDTFFEIHLKLPA